MQLISGLLSNNAAKVRIVMAEKGLQADVVDIPWTRARAWQPKPAVLLDANPRAEVPVLIDGDLTLWDSTVINEYLEESFPAPAMLPEAPVERALCRLWEDEGDYNQVHIGVLIRDVFLAEPGAALTEEAVDALAALGSLFDRLDAQLSGREYVCDDYSLADVSLFLIAAFAITLGYELTQERVVSWYDRMLQRPAVGAEFAAIIEGVAAL